MRALNRAQPTRRNPKDVGDDVLMLGAIGLLLNGGFAVYEQIRGIAAVGKGAGGALAATGHGVGGALAATGQGVGGALASTGQAGGQTASAVGSGAHNFVTTVGTSVSNAVTNIGGALRGLPIPSPAMAKLATQWRLAAAANVGGSDPNDWNAFRTFAQQISAPDPGPTPFAGWPHQFGGSVLNVTTQQYE